MRWTMGKWMAATKIGIKYLEYVLCIYTVDMWVHFLRVPLISLSQNQMKQIRNILSNPSFLTKSRIFPWGLTDLGDPSMLQSGDSGVANSPGPSPKSWSNRSCFGKNDKNDLKGHGKQTRNERNNKSTSVLNIFWSISNSHSHGLRSEQINHINNPSLGNVFASTHGTLCQKRRNLFW